MALYTDQRRRVKSYPVIVFNRGSDVRQGPRGSCLSLSTVGRGRVRGGGSHDRGSEGAPVATSWAAPIWRIE